MLRLASAALALAAAGCSLGSLQRAASEGAWQTLEPGLELGGFDAPLLTEGGAATVHVLRVDPRRFALRLLNASAPGEGVALTARGWTERYGLLAAINASMYQEDYRTSVSLMRTPGHVNNPRLTRHMAVLAFDALDPAVPPVKILDFECDRYEDWKDRYATMVQSIRMLSCSGRNVWTPQPRRTSTAAIGTDAAGRVLLIHVRARYATHDLIEALRDLPLDLDRLMYAEGGPEAQLYVRAAAGDREFVGGLETQVDEHEEGFAAWPVPNVIGVVRRAG